MSEEESTQNRPGPYSQSDGDGTGSRSRRVLHAHVVPKSAAVVPPPGEGPWPSRTDVAILGNEFVHASQFSARAVQTQEAARATSSHGGEDVRMPGFNDSALELLVDKTVGDSLPSYVMQKLKKHTRELGEAIEREHQANIRVDKYVMQAEQ